MLYLMADIMKVATRIDDPHMAKLRPYRNRRRRWSAPRWWLKDR